MDYVTDSGAIPGVIQGADGTDFVGGSFPRGTVTFNATETSKIITINVQGDLVVEPDESFTVTLSNPSGNAQVTTATVTGTILNDDKTLAIATTDAFKYYEGDSGPTPFTFTVFRTGDTRGTTMVDYAVTGSGTNPANGTDFVGGSFPSGTVTSTPRTRRSSSPSRSRATWRSNPTTTSP